MYKQGWHNDLTSWGIFKGHSHQGVHLTKPTLNSQYLWELLYLMQPQKMGKGTLGTLAHGFVPQISENECWH